MWLSLGLVMNVLFYPGGIIGYIGCMYFMLKAFEVVKPVEVDKLDKENQLKTYQSELADIKNRLGSTE